MSSASTFKYEDPLRYVTLRTPTLTRTHQYFAAEFRSFDRLAVGEVSRHEVILHMRITSSNRGYKHPYRRMKLRYPFIRSYNLRSGSVVKTKFMFPEQQRR